ncbi:hypothetical protein OG301_26575 [Streptomyces platensis]|uniref:helix-turn-helix domain-containing protein n=1 Tax=Streptomyces platensis TaxID=58346 RepID=UPI002ED47CDF|nr:hypothetical protein OG301_26575 [Streptomyces platensis]
MDAAGLTPAQLARRVKVASATVDRWLDHPERTPHHTTASAVANVLEVELTMLWPKAVKSVVKTGADREIVTAYPYRTACPPTVWDALLDGTSETVTYAGFTNYFIWQNHPRIADRLRAKAAQGTRVQFLIGDPGAEVTARRERIEDVPLTLTTRINITMDALSKIKDQAGIEARLTDHDQHIALSVFRFDDQMLVTPHLSSLLGHESPMFHLRRMGDAGMFDRFAGHVDALWESARPAW